MSDRKVLTSEDERATWRMYFQAALTGLLAAGQLNPQSSGVPEIITKACGQVADKALDEEELRKKPKGGVGVMTV